MKLSEMKQLLAAGKIQLTRSLGQNFMHDGNQLRRMIALAGVGDQDAVLEIGPGLGPLTELLLARAREVMAVEVDARLCELLRQRFGSDPKWSLVHADALEFLRQNPRDWSHWQIVANLPYSVGSPILVECARLPLAPRRLTVTLQLEVARRLMSRAGEADYGLLTLLVQLRYVPAGMFKIPAACFFPAPDVASACVRLDRRPTPLLDPAGGERFVQIVKRAFSQRRKMMFKLLKSDWPAPDLERGFAEAGLHPQIRAEEVTLEQFVQLTGRLRAKIQP